MPADAEPLRSGATGARTQPERRAESEATLVQVGIRLFASQGVHRTTLAEVGTTGGYSRGLPVYLFGTKNDFVRAILRSMDSWFDAVLEKNIGDSTGLDALDARIGSHLEGAERSPQAVSALYAIYVEAMFGSPELRPAVDELTAKWRQGFADHLREAHVAGEVEVTDFAQRGALLLALTRSFLMDYLMSDSALDLGVVRSSIVSFARVAIARPDGPSAR